MQRREFLKHSGQATGATALSTSYFSKFFSSKRDKLNNNINHSVCRWCYSKMPLGQLIEGAKEIGVASVELLDPEDWDQVLKAGLQVGLSNGSPLGITKGFNNPSLHMELSHDYLKLIPLAAEKGIKQVICFSGNRGNLSDEQGIENCAQGLKRIVQLAEKHEVTICMELLNSSVDHHDYMCDHTEWGVALVDKIGSPNFKLLYDIYHMQIMEGNVIATLTKYKDYISHFHTGGVPGRNEIDHSQELNYPAIMKAIIDNGFEGYVAQEFIPTKDRLMDSLQDCVQICDV